SATASPPDNALKTLFVQLTGRFSDGTTPVKFTAGTLLIPAPFPSKRLIAAILVAVTLCEKFVTAWLRPILSLHPAAVSLVLISRENSLVRTGPLMIVPPRTADAHSAAIPAIIPQ